MERKAASGIMLTMLLLIGMLTLAFNIQLAKSEPSRNYSWVPNVSGSYVVENSWTKYVSDSGYDNQGPNTIVHAFRKTLPGWPDNVWNGEYEYVSIDGETTWTGLMLKNGITRTLYENVFSKDYTIVFNTAGTLLADLTISKNIVISETARKLSLKYTFSSTKPVTVQLYYSIDICDWESTQNCWDKIYDKDRKQVTRSGWYWTNELWVDTLGSGSMGLKTEFPAWYYAGHWYRALYGAKEFPWTSGEDITLWDLGGGVKIDFGRVGSSVSMGFDMPDSDETVAPEEPPNPHVPEFPLGAALEIALVPVILYIWSKSKHKPTRKPKLARNNVSLLKVQKEKRRRIEK